MLRSHFPLDMGVTKMDDAGIDYIPYRVDPSINLGVALKMPKDENTFVLVNVPPTICWRGTRSSDGGVIEQDEAEQG